MTSSDVSSRESSQLAVASATHGPWRSAGAIGLVGGAAALGINLITFNWSFSILSTPASVALCLFFLIGGVGSVLSKRGERRLRRWAQEHPWQTAAVPAVGLFISNTVAQFLLSSSGIFGSIWAGLWPAVLIGAIIGVVGSVAATRRRNS